MWLRPRPLRTEQRDSPYSKLLQERTRSPCKDVQRVAGTSSRYSISTARNGSLARSPCGSSQRRNLMWTTMEVIMSTTFYTPATIRVRWRGSGLIATVQTWWMSYLTRRIERAAIIQLHGMSERELQDIGLIRSQIEGAVRGELDNGRQGRGCDGARRTLQSRAADHYRTNGLGPPGDWRPRTF